MMFNVTNLSNTAKGESSIFVVKRTKIVEFLFLLIVTYSHFMFNRAFPSNENAWVISLVIWCYGVIGARKSLPLLVFYFFIFSYIKVPYYHYVEQRQISIYTDFQSEILINKVAFLNTMFLALLSFLVSGLRDSMLVNPQDWCRSNKFVFWLSLLPCLIAIIFGLSGETIFTAGYGSGLSSKSALHEYFIVFFLFCLLFMGRNNRLHWAIVFVLGVTYSLKTLIYGGRIEVIQLILLFGFVGFNYLKSYSRIKIFVLSGVFLGIMTSLGVVRGHFYSLITSGDPLLKFVEILIAPDNNPYVLSTSADVYYASIRLLGMLEAGLLELDFRLSSFLAFLLNLPLSLSSLRESANLASLHGNIYPTGGGGLIATYFYVWFGYVGVIVSALSIGFVIRKFYASKGFIWRAYGIAVLVTFPRWWAYTPINLTKLCVVAVLLYLFYLALTSLRSTSVKHN